MCAQALRMVSASMKSVSSFPSRRTLREFLAERLCVRCSFDERRRRSWGSQVASFISHPLTCGSLLKTTIPSCGASV